MTLLLFLTRLLVSRSAAPMALLSLLSRRWAGHRHPEAPILSWFVFGRMCGLGSWVKLFLRSFSYWCAVRCSLSLLPHQYSSLLPSLCMSQRSRFWLTSFFSAACGSAFLRVGGCPRVVGIMQPNRAVENDAPRALSLARASHRGR